VFEINVELEDLEAAVGEWTAMMTAAEAGEAKKTKKAETVEMAEMAEISGGGTGGVGKTCWEATLAAFVPSQPDDTIALRALSQAVTAARLGTYGVGAVLLDGAGRVVVEAHNRVHVNGFRSDLHAEMVVLNVFEEGGGCAGEWGEVEEGAGGAGRMMDGGTGGGEEGESDAKSKVESGGSNNRRGGGALKDYTLVSTLEPCPMCMTRIIFSGIGTIKYVQADDVGGMVQRKGAMPYVKYDRNTLNSVVGGKQNGTNEK
jgi:tRNA(Arg) A34 adenosine deaminase TadA